MELTRAAAKRRVERFLKTQNKVLKIPKSIADRAKHGKAYVIDLESKEILKSNTNLTELLAEYGLLLEGDSYEDL